MVTRSDKLKRIVSMACEIVDNGEQCIIFTQYIGMGNLIRQCLSELHDIDAPFLTGSMPKGQRDLLVEAFQKVNSQCLYCLLRAGGTGLNLTAANHVFMQTDGGILLLKTKRPTERIESGKRSLFTSISS